MPPFVRNIVADLVEKRLWPVALLLFGALVAVPLVLSKKESPAPKPTASSRAVAAPLNGQALISLDTGRTGRLVGGGGNDPFQQRFVPGTTVARAEARSGTTVNDNVEVNVDEGGGAGAGGSSGGSGGTAPSRPRRTRTTAERALLVFGRTDQTRRSYRVEALTAMPSTTNPLLVYLGRVGAYGVFLVSSDATPTGDGRCSPSASVCSEIRLRVGDTEYFDVSTSRGEIQYQLDFRGFARG